jgi:hypothetical protein
MMIKYRVQSQYRGDGIINLKNISHMVWALNKTNITNFLFSKKINKLEVKF